MTIHARVALPLSLLLAASALTPALSTASASASASASAAPQNQCSGAFCTTVDLVTTEALAPAQATSAAAQPTDLRLSFTNTSAALATDKSVWLSKVSAVLGTSSAKTMAVTDPAALPLGSYVGGSSATAASCAGASDFAAACPAGHGAGLVEVGGLLPTTTKQATFGITRVTVGAGGTLTAELTIRIDGELLPGTTTTALTYAPATASAGPSIALATTPAVTPPVGYLSADFSMSSVALTLNGLVTESAAGPLTPPRAFVRHSPICTTITSTLAAQARSTTVTAAPFPQTITGCPSPPAIVSVSPVAGQPRAFAFTTKTPSASLPGRTASLAWVFGDGSKAVTGSTTTHTYPVSQPVTAVVSAVDSAGARSSAVQVKIGASALRGKQKEGHLITGELTDQGTGEGIARQELLAYRCATRNTPFSACQDVGTTTTNANGEFRLRIPEVKRKGFVMVSHAGTATSSAKSSARFGSTRYIAVLPQPQVTLKVSKNEVHPGGTVRLTGIVEPGKRGRTVRLQGFLRGKWRSVGRATISQRGTYAASYVVRVPGQDKLKLRALVAETARTLQATSKVRKVTILR